MSEDSKEVKHGQGRQPPQRGWLNLLLGYLLIAVLSMPYHSWRYLSIHGVSAWWSGGVGTSARRAAFWPIYSVYDDMPRKPSFSESDRKCIKHFKRSIDASMDARRLLRQMREDGEGGRGVTESQASAYRSLLSVAIDESDLVDDKALRKVHPELPKRFVDDYVPAITLAAFSFESHDHESAVQAVRLWNNWIYWIEENEHSFNLPR